MKVCFPTTQEEILDHIFKRCECNPRQEELILTLVSVKDGEKPPRGIPLLLAIPESGWTIGHWEGRRGGWNVEYGDQIFSVKPSHWARLPKLPEEK